MKDTRRQRLTQRLRLSSPKVPRLVRLAIHISAIFLVSCLGTLAGGYFVSHHIAGSRIALTDLVRIDFLLPLLVVAVAVTLGLTGLLMFIESRTRRGIAEIEPHAPGVTINPDRVAARAILPPDQHRRLLTLTRSAERLGAVERDLIRKINDSYELDLTTHRLIREVQVCTNHVLAQLSEIAPELRESDLSERREALLKK